MDAELERRIGAAVRLVADSVPVSVPSGVERAPVPGAVAAWRAPVLTAAAVVLLLLAVAVVLPGFRSGVPGPGRGSDTAGTPADAPVLPTEFAGLSLLTASVSDAPPGPAITLYRLGALGTRWGTSQVVTVGVDGRTYRRLDLAESRGSDGNDGERHLADTLLAPDGAGVAVADGLRVRDRIEVVDLRTGRVAGHRLDRAAAVDLLDWSPDGSRLAFTAYDTPMDGTERPGRLAVLDLRTGTVTRPGDLTMGRGAAAFSPDGDRLAVVHTALTASARSVSVLDRAGTVVWTLPDRAPAQVTWSPDGTLLAATYLRPERCQLVFLDATGRDGPVPAPVEFPGGTAVDGVVGWRSPGAVLVRTGSQSGPVGIVEVPVAGGPRHRLSRIPDGVTGFGRPGEVQLAEGLVGGVQVRGRDVERGPWPTWWRLTVAVTALLVGAALVRWGRRRRPATVSGRPARR